MANVVNVLLLSILLHVTCVFVFISLAHTQDSIVFQPSYLTATGPSVTALLLGNTSKISLNLRTVSPSNETGSIDSQSCVPEKTQWIVTRNPLGKTATRVSLTLVKSLHLCDDNETDADCCPKPLCVLETLQLSACMDNTLQATLLIQVKIHALLVPVAGYDNKTTVPNLYGTLGSCPCDLTLGTCDVRCCCDKDCSIEEFNLFESHCLLGPFGGQVSPAADYQCSEVSENSPDWFPFLCVTSPPENNPYLGHFYQGATVTPKPAPSFQSLVLSAPVLVNKYIQGSPIYTSNDQFFTIPQKVLGYCVNNAQVAFLKNFKVRCVTLLHSCPIGFPLQTLLTDLRTGVKNGQGGDFTVRVIDEVAIDLREFMSSKNADAPSDDMLVCENVSLALDYRLYWNKNGITNITLTRTLGTITFNNSVALTTRYSAVFLNGQYTSESKSGNPGYQVGRPVIAGILHNNSDDNMDNNTGNNMSIIQRTKINIWKPVNDGFCATAEKGQILFGYNKTSGCLLPISLQNLTQCNLLRDTVTSIQESLVRATYVAKSGNPDPQNVTDWVNISYLALNSNTAVEGSAGSCHGIPSHQHIRVWTLVTGSVNGIPQRDIHALQISYSLSTWALDCGGGDIAPCVDLKETELFPIASSVTFMDIPINTGLPKTRFQINFTEYDCNRNDVCWPELAFPLTKYYTGEPYSQSLAKGLILVFFLIIATVFGNLGDKFERRGAL